MSGVRAEGGEYGAIRRLWYRVTGTNDYTLRAIDSTVNPFPGDHS